MSEEKALAFVTKKALVTFTQPIGMVLSGNVVMCNVAVCEYVEEVETTRRDYFQPRELKVVSLGDGRKLSRTLTLRLLAAMGGIAGLVELENGELT